MSDPAPPAPKVLVAVWAALVALVLGSLGCSRLGWPDLALALVAGATAVKLLLVARSYMDLAREPRWVAAILLSALGFIVLLLVLAAPDVALRVGQ